jgi:KUP system potassium uptake protein
MSETSDQQGGRYLLLMSLGALGVVYGDIGTSPLYAFREAFVAAEGLAVDRSSVLGILSLMTWSLILIVSVKYLIFVMRADNHGEGGILALTALVTPRTLEAGKRRRRYVILIGLFGTALLYGDGIITPAISVLSAVEGLEVAAPGLDHFVVPIAVVILAVLFSVQRRGTASIGVIFGPVMIVWFTVLAILGIGHIGRDPGVLAALLPTHAARFIFEQPRLAFLALGAIFLVVTGSEALYADMGHFGRRPIRLGWFTLVFPALLLNYYGQGALLLRDAGAVDNPFYRLPPDWAVLPLVVLATLATVIASQALISGAYSLTMQAVQLGYLPRVGIDHTSPREIGQVYVGSVNWGLMAACVALVVAFGSSTNLAAAYGVAVTTTMVITTALLYIVMRERWEWSVWTAAVVTGIFVIVDLSFFSANIVKIPAGGWIPLLIGAVGFAAMASWKRGRERLIARQRGRSLPIERFIGSISEHPQERVPGTAVYLTPTTQATPPALLTNLRFNEVLHRTIVLVTVRTAATPRVQQARRATVHTLGEEFYQVELSYGFFEQPDVPKALASIVHEDFGFDPTDATYVLGRETIVAREPGWFRAIADRLFIVLHRNAAGAARYFRLPPEQIIEVGSQVEI